jgi:hypothetical protein
MLEGACWIINIALVLVLTYLYRINQPLTMTTPQVNRHVEAPINKVTFPKLVGRVFDASIILEDELEVRVRLAGLTSLHKIDRYFYENCMNLYINESRLYAALYTFQVNISVRERWSAYCWNESRGSTTMATNRS